MKFLIYFLKNPYEFFYFIKFIKKNRLKKNFKNFFYVEMFNDPLIFFYMVTLLKKFQEKHRSNIFTVIYSPSNSFKNYVSILIQVLFLRILNIKIIFLKKTPDYQEIKKLVDKIETREDLFKLKYKNVFLGHAIYDEYLRVNNEPTISSIKNNSKLKKTITNTIKIIINLNFDNITGALIFHDTYNPSGPIKEALISLNKPVYGTFDITAFSFLHFKQDSFYIPWKNSKKNFLRLSGADQVSKINVAKKILDNLYDYEYQANALNRTIGLNKIKFNNSLNSWINNETSIISSNNKKKIGVFLHAFSDAPNRFKRKRFVDYWEWACFILDNAINTEFDWYIKPHPMDEKAIVINQLKEKYSQQNIHFLAPTINNKFFIENKFSSIFTCHGTCCYEFALFNIPVITFGECPTMAYNFNIHCLDDTDLLKQLVNSADKININCDKKEIYMSYYMNFLFFKEFRKKLLPENYFKNFYDGNLLIYKFAAHNFNYNVFEENFNFWMNLDLYGNDKF